MGEPKRLREFLEWSYPPLRSYIGKGLLYEKNKMLVYGMPKSLKSMLLQDLMICLANGKPWCGLETSPASVFYLMLEGSEVLWQRRLLKRVGDEVDTFKDVTLWVEQVLTIDEENSKGLMQLEHWLDEFKPDILILDPLYKLLTTNISDNYSISRVLNILDRLIDKYGCSIILVHHSVKTNQEDNHKGADNMLGPRVLTAWGDTMVEVVRDKGMVTINADVVRYAEEEIEPIRANMDKELRFSVKEGK